MMKVLLVDDDPLFARTIAHVLEEHWSVLSALTGAEGLAVAERERLDAVLLDIGLPDIDGMEVLRRLVARPFAPPVVMLTAHQEVKLVRESILAGAYDYVVKYCDLRELEGTLRRAVANAELRRAHAARASCAGDPLARLAGEAPAMLEVKELVARYARSDSPVLVQGESGTGKELVARSLHSGSYRAPGPFIALNCGAIPDGLAETELFGAERGAYTDAVSRAGSFERAGGGTLFLDEVGELSPRAQAGLLRVLEQKELVRVGGTRAVALDVRVVSATNRDLRSESKRGAFREDLYWRLAVLPLRLPPLRERLDDLPLIVATLFHSLGRPEAFLAPDAEEKLMHHAWPGNVRELRNVLERALLSSDDGRIRARDIVLDA